MSRDRRDNHWHFYKVSGSFFGIILNKSFSISVGIHKAWLFIKMSIWLSDVFVWFPLCEVFRNGMCVFQFLFVAHFFIAFEIVRCKVITQMFWISFDLFVLFSIFLAKKEEGSFFQTILCFDVILFELWTDSIVRMYD